MNEVLMRSALKVLKNFISPEQIKEIVHGLINQALDYKQKIVLNADQDETTVCGIIYDVEEKAHVSIVVFDSTRKITRFEDVTLLDDLIDSLIKNL